MDPNPEKPKMMGMPYSFGYGVEDDDYDVNFSHSQRSDGKITEGQYTVQLPNGLTQVSLILS